jgi:MFS family permease
VLVATILGSSMAFIDGTVVNVALPALQQQLNANVVDVQWVIEAYSLLLSAFLLTGGSLGDQFGRRRIYVLGIIIFSAASTWCGFAASIGQLIAARAVQGLGAALLVPGSLAIISSAFPMEERGRAIGTWSGFSAITAAVGPVLGGWLIEHISWRAVFFINVPLALAVIAISIWRVPESSSKDETSLDWWGAILGRSWLGRFDLRTDRIIATRLCAPVGHDCARRRRCSPCAFFDRRGENFASYVAARTLSFANLFRREPADLFALWRAGRDPVLSAVEFDSGPALRPDCGWRGTPPTYPDHLPSFALVGRPGGKMRRQNSTGGRVH